MFIFFMKANEALKILKISRSTLNKNVKEGYIKVTKLLNECYDYNEKSVCK